MGTLWVIPPVNENTEDVNKDVMEDILEDDEEDEEEGKWYISK